MPARERKRKKAGDVDVPPMHDWRTSDQDEIARRRLRAIEGHFRISNTDARHEIHSTFEVRSGEDRMYEVEVRDAARREVHCTCVDFRVNGLGTCKHAEAVWLHLEARRRTALRSARENGSDRVEVVPDSEAGTLRLVVPENVSVRRVALRRWFDDGGLLKGDCDPGEATARLRALSESAMPELRVSREVDGWIERKRRSIERVELRRVYEWKVQSGEWPVQETKVPLFPYQREGMLHLAFGERVMLADEMGLGKTIQGVAACALLHRLGKAKRVLVVTPASLKGEWEEQIRRFTDLPCRLVYGSRHLRLALLREIAAAGTAGAGATLSGGNPVPFFVVMNYEQAVPDVREINEILRPDVVILDEAQRIKNWNTKTAKTIKQLRSRYAFVLTGTPIENRIDELRSLVDFLDPSILGPLFRFNREFYEFDERGRPAAYANLTRLHERVKPVLLRRRKADVETELPPRTDRNLFVPMTESQTKHYGDHEKEVLRLINIAERRLLTERELENLQIQLAMMRMVCDTPYILDSEDRTCPKLAELETILEECGENGSQVIVFSEWERMLMLVRDWCVKNRVAHAWHTGSVPQKKRRDEIHRFKTDPGCRVFLTTDAGATGLNLQNASVVVNCDLPWNPARLEQRIARAWRKNQLRNVTVFHLISENTIEHRMLDTLAMKRSVAESVLDKPGSIDRIPLRSGRKDMIERIRGLVVPARGETGAVSLGEVASRDERLRVEEERREIRKKFDLDPAGAFTRFAAEKWGPKLLSSVERRGPGDGRPTICFTVSEDAETARRKVEELRQEFCARVGEEPEVFAASLPPVVIVDRAVQEAIDRMVASGFLVTAQLAGRAIELTEPPAPSPLTREEIERCREARQRGRHVLKRGRVLGGAGFEEDCVSSLLEAALAAAKARAIELRLPEPASLSVTFDPPYRVIWGEGLDSVRELATDSARWEPAAKTIESVLQTGETTA